MRRSLRSPITAEATLFSPVDSSWPGSNQPTIGMRAPVAGPRIHSGNTVACLASRRAIGTAGRGGAALPASSGRDIALIVAQPRHGGTDGGSLYCRGVVVAARLLLGCRAHLPRLRPTRGEL